MGVVRPLRAGVATLATAGLAIGSSQMFVPQAQASNSSVKARVSARTAVNVRAKASTTGKILGVLDRGQQLNQTGIPVNGWVPVAYRGHTAFIDHHYLSSVAWRPSAPSPSASNSPVGIAQATTYVNVRAGHSMQAAKVGMLSPGERVGLTGRSSQGFSEVIYNGVHRWVGSRYLSAPNKPTPAPKPTPRPAPAPAPRPAPAKTVYTTTSLNLRNSASTSAPVYTSVPRGTALVTTGQTTSGWTQITYHRRTLWAASKYLTTNAQPTPAPKRPVSPRGARAAIVNYATAQIGKVYIWGGEGPDGFDCSGLVLKAYQQAGLNLPHYSGSQIERGHRISLDQIQPGDLFAASGGGHVGIYVGNGQMVEAANPRAGVRLSPIRSSMYPLRINSDILD